MRVFPVVQTLLILVLLVVCAIQLGIANTSRKRIKQLTAQQQWLLQRVEEVEGWLSTPEMEGVEAVDIDGQWVKTMAYALVDDPDIERFSTVHFARTTEPPHPEYSVFDPLEGPVPFHPYQWSRNLLAAVQRGQSVDALLAEVDAHTVRYRGADFFEHPFRFTLPLIPVEGEPSYALEAPWFSGLAQGYVLGALVELARSTGEPAHRERAARAFESFLCLRGEPGQAEPWVSFVDEYDYLWFEEYAQARDPQPRVINGHIGALEGLHAYHRFTGDERAATLLRCGATTIHRYAGDFRRPGETLRYCLGLPDGHDYGPVRAILQQEWLHALTGEEFFGRMARLFRVDMRLRDG